MRLCRPAKFGDEGFATTRREAINARQQEYIAAPRAGCEREQNQRREPRFTEVRGQHNRKSHQSEDYGENSYAGERRDSRSALPAERSEIESLRRIERQQIPRNTIHHGRKEHAGKGGERDAQARRTKNDGYADPDEEHFRRQNHSLGQVLSQEYFAKAHGRHEEELNAGGIGSETVVREIAENQQRIGHADRESEINVPHEKIGAAAGVGSAERRI